MLAVMAILIAAYLILSRDAPPFDDSDLRPTRLDIPDEDNGYTYLNLKESDLYSPSDDAERSKYYDIKRWKAWDEDIVGKANEHNKHAVECFEKAMTCKHFQAPEVKNWDSELPYLRSCHGLAPYLSILARYLQKQGKEKEAFELAMRIVEFGDCVEKSNGIFVVYVTGTSIKKVGLDTFADLLRETQLDSQSLQPYIDKLSQYETTQESLVNAIKADYTMDANTIEGLAAGKLDKTWDFAGVSVPRPGYFFHPLATKKLLAKGYRAVIDYANAEFMLRGSSSGNKEYGDLIEECESASRISPNKIGRWLILQILPGPELMIIHKYRSLLATRFTQLLIALKCYKLDHRDLPDSLDQLVPEYIESVPLDPYDEKPLRYSKDKRILWSVGTDLVDDGGYTQPEGVGPDTPGPVILIDSKLTDPTTRIEF